MILQEQTQPNPSFFGLVPFLGRARCVITFFFYCLAALKEDESDNRYVALALVAKATYLVTDDDDLLKLEQYNGIGIVTPAQFLWRVYKIIEEQL